jgi:hypothetical protein
MGELMEWARILAYISGTVDQELLLRNEYLAAENQILRGQLKGRPKLSDVERGSSARLVVDWAAAPASFLRHQSIRESCVLDVAKRTGFRVERRHLAGRFLDCRGHQLRQSIAGR